MASYEIWALLQTQRWRCMVRVVIISRELQCFLSERFCFWDFGEGGEGVYYRNFILLIIEIRELTAQEYLLPKPFLIKNIKVETETT